MQPTLPSAIWHFYGPSESESPPSVLVLGGTHGDELTGQWLVERWLSRLGMDGLPAGSYPHPAVQGNLYIGYGNPAAMAKKARSASEIRDLNRCFERRLLDNPELQYEDILRARELEVFLANMDYLFDVHAVSTTQVEPFVCFGALTDELRALCAMIPVDRVLTDPDNILPTDDPDAEVLSTTDSWVARAGGTALCYETGYQEDESKLPLAERVVASLLSKVNVASPTLVDTLLHGVPEVDTTPTTSRFFRLTHCVRIERLDPQFQHAPEMLTNWHPVQTGECFGVYTDGQQVLIPADGFLVFPTTVARMMEGKSFFFIAAEIV